MSVLQVVPDANDNEEREEGAPRIQRTVKVLCVGPDCHEHADEQKVKVGNSSELLKERSKCEIKIHVLIN